MKMLAGKPMREHSARIKQEVAHHVLPGKTWQHMGHTAARQVADGAQAVTDGNKRY